MMRDHITSSPFTGDSQNNPIQTHSPTSPLPTKTPPTKNFSSSKYSKGAPQVNPSSTTPIYKKPTSSNPSSQSNQADSLKYKRLFPKQRTLPHKPIAETNSTKGPSLDKNQLSTNFSPKKTPSPDTNPALLEVQQQRDSALEEIARLKAEFDSVQLTTNRNIADLAETIIKLKDQLGHEAQKSQNAEHKLHVMECELAELSNNIQIEAQNIVITERKERKAEVDRLIKLHKETKELLEMERMQVHDLKEALENCGKMLDQEKNKREYFESKLKKSKTQSTKLEIKKPTTTHQNNIESLHTNSKSSHKKQLSESVLKPQIQQLLHITTKNLKSETYLNKPKPLNQLQNNNQHTFDQNYSPELRTLNSPISSVYTNFDEYSSTTKNRPDINDTSLEKSCSFNENLKLKKSNTKWVICELGFLDSSAENVDINDIKQLVQAKSDKDAFQTPFFQKIYKEELEPTVIRAETLNISSKLGNTIFSNWNRYKKILASIQENTLIIEAYSVSTSPTFDRAKTEQLFFTESMVNTNEILKASSEPIASRTGDDLKLKDDTNRISGWLFSKISINTTPPIEQKPQTSLSTSKLSDINTNPGTLKATNSFSHEISNSSRDLTKNVDSIELPTPSPTLIPIPSLNLFCNLCEKPVFTGFSDQEKDINILHHQHNILKEIQDNSNDKSNQQSAPETLVDSNGANIKAISHQSNEHQVATAHYYKFRYNDIDKTTKPICFDCHFRIFSVCEFYRYLRLARSGLIKGLSLNDIKYQIIRLRTILWAIRLGASATQTYVNTGKI
ncbi:hypothetical protein BB559_003828 [Furculomyces boomerangus]|uniref:GDP/GTP exchange factor Sec2 N-terminal domain-containing protein n=1 Tax=Furculomyces boomerangus TaxID=61424 RepID=A0A2T9YIK0_9FUNG|nr:hypothetical protein BB559_003828 [Furculomyces boomerangus]